MKLIAPDDHMVPTEELQKMFDQVVEQLAPTRSAILIVVKKTSNKSMQAQLLSALPPALTAIILSDLVRIEVERMRMEIPTTQH